MSTNIQDPVEQFLLGLQQQERPYDPNDPVEQFLEGRYGGGEEQGFFDALMHDPGSLALAAGQAIAPLLKQIPGAVAGGIGDLNTMAKIIATPAGWTTAIEALRGNPDAQQELARAAITAGGVLEGGLVDPAQGVLGLPGAMLGEELPTDKVADWINRASLGAKNRAEDAALRSGMTEDDIAQAYAAGNFFGYTVPITASFKMASLALRTSQLTGQALRYGTYTTDWLAGLIYGGIFEEGAAKERLGSALRESAVFGVMRVLMSLGIPVRAIRHRRARELDVSGDLDRRLTALENGQAAHFDTPEDIAGHKGVLQIMQEENYISHSEAALELLQQREYHLALAQSIIENQGAGASAGVVKNVATTWPRTVELIDKFRAKFTGLKIEAVKGPDGSYSIFWGVKGLNNAQRQAFKNTGRFKGMTMHYGSEVVEFAGDATRAGWVKIRLPDGTVKEVMERNTTLLPHIVEDIRGNPETDALFQQFAAWAEANHKKLVEGRIGFTEADLVEAARKGELPLDFDAIREWDTPALIYAEELGLVGEDAITNISLTNPNYPEFIARITRNTRRGSTSMYARGGNVEGPWRITMYETDFQGVPHVIGHTAHNDLGAALDYAAQVHGFQVEDVLTKFPTKTDLVQLISHGGMENANVLQPVGGISFEDAFAYWAKENGIKPSMTDYWSMRTYFSQRLRRQNWEILPTEDKEAFIAMRDEYFKLMEEFEDKLSLPQLAAQKGFHLTVERDGRHILRAIDTGLTFSFGSERVAREVLATISRPEKDLPILFATGGHGIPDWSRGLPKSDAIFPEELTYDVSALRKIMQNFIRNNRDWLLRVEETTKLPVWSKGFELIQQGYITHLNRYEPYGKAIDTAWKGIKLERRKEIAEFWVAAEEAQIGLKEAVSAMRTLGFNSREIQAFRRSRAIFDDLFSKSGIDPNRYIQMYYTRIRPYIEQEAVPDLVRIFGDDLTPVEKEFWAEFTRTGDLPQLELDPRLVMHRYAKTMFWMQEVREPWENLAKVVGFKARGTKFPATTIGDLKKAGVELSSNNVLPGTRDDSPAIPNLVRNLLQEYLTIIRGDTSHTTQTLRLFADRLFHSMKIDVDPRILEEMVNSWMAMQYGAAMGLRPMTVARNMTQVMWLLGGRIGSRWMGRGLERSMTYEGYLEALEVGAIHQREAGIPIGQTIFEHITEESPQALSRFNPISRLGAPVLRGVSGVMRWNAELGRKSLIWYSGSDDASRAWAYWAHKLHTSEWLAKYEAGKISWEAFEEGGLPYFAPTLKRVFRETYNSAGAEQALRRVGRWASDEANFIYGLGAQGPWLQTIPGRLLGMFGTWPLWAFEAYVSRPLRYATPKQQALLAIRTATMIGGFINMGLQTGIDMWSWIAPASMGGYSGGPFAEHLINLRRLWDSPIEQKRSALERMLKDVSRLTVPGQVFFMEMARAADIGDYDPEKAALSMVLGKPYKDRNFGMEYLYNPELRFQEPWISPETFIDQEERQNGYPSWLDTFTFIEGSPPEAMENRRADQLRSLEDVVKERESVVEGLLNPEDVDGS